MANLLKGDRDSHGKKGMSWNISFTRPSAQGMPKKVPGDPTTYGKDSEFLKLLKP